MNCCNGDCDQGRSCPTRTRKVSAYPVVPEDVAPFEYVPTWRDYLPDLARAVLLVIAGMLIGASLGVML